MNRYYIMSIEAEGPARVEGNASYPSESAATKECKKLLRDRHGHRKLAVFKRCAMFWVDPEPAILTDSLDGFEE